MKANDGVVYFGQKLLNNCGDNGNAKIERQSEVCECCPRYLLNTDESNLDGHMELCKDNKANEYLILNEVYGVNIREDCEYSLEHILFKDNKANGNK